MILTELTCLSPPDSATLPILTARPASLDAVLETLPPRTRAFVRASGFRAEAPELLLLPDMGDLATPPPTSLLHDDTFASDARAAAVEPHDAATRRDADAGALQAGIAGALLGLGADRSHAAFGDLATRLPPHTNWRFIDGDYTPHVAVLGFCNGAYRYGAFKAEKRPPARLLPPAGTEAALREAAATWMVRDLINTPANLLGPAELAQAAAALAAHHGAACVRIEGDELAQRYPVIDAVGRGSVRPPVVVRFDWRGSAAQDDAPRVALVGKGVVFDTGGYDLKPSAAMLRMKKDMGGAAHVLGLARLVMEADLPVRLSVWVGCAENSISGAAMRPSDVLRSRHGLSIEVGNTDAEGRLLLCDLLAEAAALRPRLLIDYATLTGAARVALGPDLPALFCNDDAIASQLTEAATAVHDPLWRLPLWPGYETWLNSNVADIGSVASKPMAGAIVAALFLQRFVGTSTAEIHIPWAHIDVYAWNDTRTPGRPEGGEAQGMRAALRIIEQCANAAKVK